MPYRTAFRQQLFLGKINISVKLLNLFAYFRKPSTKPCRPNPITKSLTQTPQHETFTSPHHSMTPSLPFPPDHPKYPSKYLLAPLNHPQEIGVRGK